MEYLIHQILSVCWLNTELLKFSDMHMKTVTSGMKVCVSIAAQYGRLDCLRYAHENGCPWDETTCRYAAQYGHLDILRYAHENGCPWNESTCDMQL